MFNQKNIRDMKTIYAFGEPVPQEILDEIESEFGKECLNTDFIETLFEYEYRDNE